MRTVGADVDNEIWETIDYIAKAKGTTKSDIIRGFIKIGLKAETTMYDDEKDDAKEPSNIFRALYDGKCAVSHNGHFRIYLKRQGDVMNLMLDVNSGEYVTELDKAFLWVVVSTMEWAVEE